MFLVGLLMSMHVILNIFSYELFLWLQSMKNVCSLYLKILNSIYLYTIPYFCPLPPHQKACENIKK